MTRTPRMMQRCASKYIVKLLFTLVITACVTTGSLMVLETNDSGKMAITRIGISPEASADSNYANLSSGNLNFAISASTTNLITTNDDWSIVPSVEGYFGQNLTATHGVDPQTVLGTEFPGHPLPNNPRQVNANKGNPSAYNAGGLAEFDSGTYLAIGFQGNVQANPYMIFYLDTLGRSNVTINYEVTDIDSGSNNAVSPVALQYRVGSTGLFTNLPDGFVADATDGPNIGGRVTAKSVVLPAATWNQAQVQVRIITTNAANSSGGSTPDEWIGVNNVLITSLVPTAAQVEVSGRVSDQDGRALSGVIVTIFDEFGNPRSTRTNSFGFYTLRGITAGGTYLITASSKRYVFDTQVLTVNDNVSGVNFVALGPPTYVPDKANNFRK